MFNLTEKSTELDRMTGETRRWQLTVEGSVSLQIVCNSLSLSLLISTWRDDTQHSCYITKKTSRTTDKMDLMEIDSSRTPVYLSWLGAILGTVLVGLSGLLPMLIIPLDAGENLRSEQGSRRLRLLLSFAVGGLLGDVFLHLFPESYGAISKSGRNTHTGYLMMGIWILGSYFFFHHSTFQHILTEIWNFFQIKETHLLCSFVR